MKTVLIRNIPDHVHEELKKRAELTGETFTTEVNNALRWWVSDDDSSDLARKLTDCKNELERYRDIACRLKLILGETED